MGLQIKCAHCSKHYAAPERLAGKTVKCPACGAAVRIPTGAAKKAATSPPTDDPDLPESLAPLTTSPLDGLLDQELPDHPMLGDLAGGSASSPLLGTPVRRNRSLRRRMSRLFSGADGALGWRGWSAIVGLIMVVALGGAILLWPIPTLRMLLPIAVPLLIVGNVVLFPLFMVAAGRRFLRVARLAHEQDGAFGIVALLSRFYVWRLVRNRRARTPRSVGVLADCFSGRPRRVPRRCRPGDPLGIHAICGSRRICAFFRLPARWASNCRRVGPGFTAGRAAAAAEAVGGHPTATRIARCRSAVRFREGGPVTRRPSATQPVPEGWGGDAAEAPLSGKTPPGGRAAQSQGPAPTWKCAAGPAGRGGRVSQRSEAGRAASPRRRSDLPGDSQPLRPGHLQRCLAGGRFAQRQVGRGLRRHGAAQPQQSGA